MSKQKPGVYQRPNSSQYWVRYYNEHDKLVRRSAQTEIEQDAWRELERCLGAVKEQRAVLNLGCPVDVGFELFMTTRSLKASTMGTYESSLGTWLLFFNQNAVQDFRQITKKVIVQFVDWRKRNGSLHAQRKGRPLTEGSIKRDVNFLSVVWAHLADHPEWEDRIGPFPLSDAQRKRIKGARNRTRFASAFEWDAILNATTTLMQKCALTVAVETGLREMEQCTLTWNAVDLENKQIVLQSDVRDTKNSRSRVIPLTNAAVSVLTDTPKAHGCPFVFWHMTEGGPQPFKRMSNWWKATRRRAGVGNFRWHDIRHTFASNFLNHGGDIKVLSHILGHSSVQVTERYAHMITGRLHEEVRRVDERSSKATQN